jgi:transcriptional regulator with XRE-family HTH domain
MRKSEASTDVAKWISKHRVKKDWTQKKLADELNVSQTLISFWEKGSQRPNAEMREKLVEVFGAGFRDEETFGMSLGEWLRSKREERKLTMGELAQKTGLSWPAIKLIEDGVTQSPHRKTVEALEKVLGELPSVQSKDFEDERKVAGFDLIGINDIDDWQAEASRTREKIPCIYIIYDKSNRPVYIGQTDNLYRRFKNHEREFWWKKPIAHRYAYIVVEDAKFRRDVEKVMIKLVGTHALMNEQHATWGEEQ